MTSKEKHMGEILKAATLIADAIKYLADKISTEDITTEDGAEEKDAEENTEEATDSIDDYLTFLTVAKQRLPKVFNIDDLFVQVEKLHLIAPKEMKQKTAPLLGHKLDEDERTFSARRFQHTICERKLPITPPAADITILRELEKSGRIGLMHWAYDLGRPPNQWSIILPNEVDGLVAKLRKDLK